MDPNQHDSARAESATAKSPAIDSIPVDAPDDHAKPFRDLISNPLIAQAILEKGYEHPTPIQSRIIPSMLNGRDVLAQSQTGTGKTAAFALPILSRLNESRSLPQVLVLTPTRELAIQVAKSFSAYGRYLTNFSVATIYGGQDYQPQLTQLRRGAPVVVGTPGRIIDHIKRGSLNLSQISTLVLDEADEMLNMGFLEDVQFLLQQAPAERQISLFSATLPEPIRQIAKRYLRDPAKVTIKTNNENSNSIRQRAVFVSPREKLDVLIRFLETEPTDGVIVFTKTKDATASVAEKLVGEGIKAVALNGDMPQRARERTIERLRAGHLDVLVATDVAARGLDVQRISHVFNFDLPHDSESYVHRIGRTGRAGRSGEAIIFLTGAQRGKLKQIERVARSRIEVVGPPTVDQINARRIERFGERIDQVLATKDVNMFQDLLQKHAEKSGQPIERIAAAVAEIGQQGRPFLLQEPPRPTQAKRTGTSSSRDQRAAAPIDEGLVRYRIQVGRRDGVQPGNIVGAVANEAGIDGQYIGSITIHDAYSTVDLPEGMPPEIFHALKSTRVVGKPLRISLERPGHPHRGKPANNRRQHAKKSARRHNSPNRDHGNKSRTGGAGQTKHKKRKLKMKK